MMERFGKMYPPTLYVSKTLSCDGLGKGSRSDVNCRDSQNTKLHGTHQYIRLDCFADNLVLRRYYEREGYEDCGEIDAHYPFGVLRLQRYQKKTLIVS